MQLESQAVVRTQDGMDVGHVKRVVFDPESKEVTHVVLSKGVLDEEKVVPLGLVGPGSDHEVTIRGEASELDHLPAFEEKHLVEPSGRSGPSASAAAQGAPLFPGAGFGQPVVPLEPPAELGPVVEVTRNIPHGTVPLKIGARVLTRDGRKVGRIERVLMDSATDHATALVVVNGFLSKTRRRIPMTWVGHVSESEVELDVGPAAFEEGKVIA